MAFSLRARKMEFFLRTETRAFGIFREHVGHERMLRPLWHLGVDGPSCHEVLFFYFFFVGGTAWQGMPQVMASI